MNSVINFSQNTDVIVADDTSSGRMILAEVLTKNGFSVKKADSAFTLAKHLADSPNASIVLNLTMPPLRGPDYVQSVRAQMSPNARLVVYTADDSENLEQSVIAAGADRFFPIPVPLDDLMLSLREMALEPAES